MGSNFKAYKITQKMKKYKKTKKNWNNNTNKIYFKNNIKVKKYIISCKFTKNNKILKNQNKKKMKNMDNNNTFKMINLKIINSNNIANFINFLYKIHILINNNILNNNSYIICPKESNILTKMNLYSQIC